MESVQIMGVPVPRIGLGTWTLRGQACVRAVRTALDLGYRHIDTAEIYGNEAEVGRAIQESGVDRQELFLTTKVWSTHLRREDVLGACRQSLRLLKTDYVDLFLIHWPSAHVPVEETLSAMNQLLREGAVRHVGVSNFSVRQLAEARRLSQAPIFCDQVEHHPFHREDPALAFCQEHGILFTAYSPLARGRVAGDGRLKDIGRRYGKTAAQVALRWLTQQEMVVAIPKASTPLHLKENLEIFDFRLSQEDMAAVVAMGG